MNPFTENELAFLQEGDRLARIATVGADGMPHVVPTGWTYDVLTGTIDIGGIELTKTKKFRDVERTGKAALVVDDVLPPWRPRGIEIRARAEVLRQPTPMIRLYPTRIVSWGLESEAIGDRHARDVDGP